MTERDAGQSWKLCNFNMRLILAMGIALLAGMWTFGFTMEPKNFGLMICCALAFLLLAFLLRRNCPSWPRLTVLLIGLGQAILLTAIAGPLSYVACAFNWPLQDAMLSALDQAMGFEARAAVLLVDSHPGVSNLLNFGYAMIKWPLLVVPVVLAMTSRFMRLQQFVTALAIALAVTIAISAATPALGLYHSLDMKAQDVPNINIMAYTYCLQDFIAVRDGSLRQLDLFELAGIVTFPSFHAASAVLYAWAFAPVRFFGPVSMVLNVLMIFSTPFMGGHYLIDVFAGIAVAVAAIAAAQWFSARPSAAVAPAYAVPAE